ncbi:MAG: AAA family ATPase [Actinobacteria bacterium]|nr:AAA family ATPase [Actinomycetota bacterium]
MADIARQMVITISGLPGAGTSTVARLVADALDLGLIDGGSLFRTMAAERGFDLAEFSKVAEDDREIDLQLDQRLSVRARQGPVVLESRLAAWIVTNEGLNATRVWIDAAEEERARRVATREGIDVDQALAASRTREASERQRFRTNYGIDLDDRSVYDLTIDSTGSDPATVAKSIVEATGKLRPS